MKPSLRTSPAADAGFTIIEMMVAVAILMVVSGAVIKGVTDMTRVNTVVTNRTDMHNGVRNATELLTQEIGQAGRISLPAAVTVTAATAAGANAITVSSVAGMFVGEKFVIDTGTFTETVQATAINGTTLTLSDVMVNAHAAGAPVAVVGGFGAGVIPDNMVNGSTATVLKIFGDINGDGNMVYVEYTCNLGLGRLYRNAMPFTAGAKVAPTVEQILIDNIQANPDGSPCFNYQRKTVTGNTYIVDVAITLTVRTLNRDPITGDFQRETKALLNVSPRNVFNVWQLASAYAVDRLQPIPPTVALLLPN